MHCVIIRHEKLWNHFVSNIGFAYQLLHLTCVILSSSHSNLVLLGVPTLPEGKEMDDNSTIEGTSTSENNKGLSGLAGLGALLPGVGMAASQAPPLANGHLNTNVRLDNQNNSDEEEEVDTTRLENDPRAIFRISNVGGSESSGGHSDRPIIRVQGEDGVGEGSPFFPTKRNVEDRRRKRELADSSLPPIEPPQSLLVAAAGNSRARGSFRGSEEGVGKAQGEYETFGVTIQEDSNRSRSPSPSRRRMRKTISGGCGVGVVRSLA